MTVLCWSNPVTHLIIAGQLYLWFLILNSDVCMKPSVTGYLCCPATERHMLRIGNLLQASMFLNYMWQKMRVAGAPARWGSDPKQPCIKTALQAMLVSMLFMILERQLNMIKEIQLKLQNITIEDDKSIGRSLLYDETFKSRNKQLKWSASNVRLHVCDHITLPDDIMLLCTKTFLLTTLHFFYLSSVNWHLCCADRLVPVSLAHLI